MHLVLFRNTRPNEMCIELIVKRDCLYLNLGFMAFDR